MTRGARPRSPGRGDPRRRGLDRRHVRRLLDADGGGRSRLPRASAFDPDAPYRCGPVSVRPESFGALVYDFHTRRLSFLRPASSSGRRGPRRPARRPRRHRGGGCPAHQRPAYLGPGRPGRERHDRAAPPRGTSEAGRALPVRPELPDLPDLGAHLRLQPGVRALPVVLGAARPARAVPPTRPRPSSTSCSGCRSSTSTSAAASRPCAATSGSCSTTRSTTTSASSSPPTA